MNQWYNKKIESKKSRRSRHAIRRTEEIFFQFREKVEQKHTINGRSVDEECISEYSAASLSVESARAEELQGERDEGIPITE